MRQLVFGGPWQLSVTEGELRPLGPGELRVAVHTVGVCGSDVHGYAGINKRRVAGMVMGHEAAGTVTELGPGVDGPAPGTPVAINPIVGCGECELCRAGDENLCERRKLYGCTIELPGAYAETFVARAANAVALDGPAPLEWGALAEPLSVGEHAARVGAIEAGEDVLVVGGGTIGLAAALAAARRGARPTISEPLEHRREVAARLRIEAVAPGEVAGRRFDRAVECVGHSATLSAALFAVPPKGHVVFVGMAEETIDLPVTPLMVGERVIQGSSTYTTQDFRAVVRWVAAGDIDLAPIIESRVGLDDLPDVFRSYAEGRNDAMKTVLQLA
jgi:2-desacetyl-2-hydroxyethyl bacteriochlorophyllide A dehydrogenase